jgi:hypothetical protein
VSAPRRMKSTHFLGVLSLKKVFMLDCVMATSGAIIRRFRNRYNWTRTQIAIDVHKSVVLGSQASLAYRTLSLSLGFGLKTIFINLTLPL